MEQKSVWGGAIEDILNQEEIPFVRESRLEPWQAIRWGSGFDTYSYYVPYACYDCAATLLQWMFDSENDTEYQESR